MRQTSTTRARVLVPAQLPTPVEATVLVHHRVEENLDGCLVGDADLDVRAGARRSATTTTVL